MKTYCRRCGVILSGKGDTYEWLTERGKKSPPLCIDCYDYAIYRYESGMTDAEIEDIIVAKDH